MPYITYSADMTKIGLVPRYTKHVTHFAKLLLCQVALLNEKQYVYRPSSEEIERAQQYFWWEAIIYFWTIINL